MTQNATAADTAPAPEVEAENIKKHLMIGKPGYWLLPVIIVLLRQLTWPG
jgi:hypothetical protein